VFEGWIEWDKIMAAKQAKIPPEQLQMFQEFYHDDQKYRHGVWQEQQAQPPSEPSEGKFRGWLEGKPNPVIPEVEARFAREDLVSPSGTKLADMFPGEIGSTFHIADAKAPHLTTHTDMLATFPTSDPGNNEQATASATTVHVQRLNRLNRRVHYLSTLTHKLQEVTTLR